MKRRALQQGDSKNWHSFFQQNIKSPSAELLHSPSYLHSYKFPNNHNRPHHTNPIYYHPFPHLIYAIYLHIQLIFLPKELKKKVVDSGRHKDDNNIKVNITDDEVPPYRIQSSVHVSGTSFQILSLSGKSSCATEKGQWLFGANVPSLSPILPAPLLTATPALINNSCTTNESTHRQVGQPYTSPHIQVRLKKKEESPQDERSSGVSQLSHFNLPRYLLDKCLPSSLAVVSLHLFFLKSPSMMALFLLEFLAFLHYKFILDVSSLPLGSLVTQRWILGLHRSFMFGETTLTIRRVVFKANYSLFAACSVTVKGNVQLVWSLVDTLFGSCDIHQF